MGNPDWSKPDEVVPETVVETPAEVPAVTETTQHEEGVI